MLSSGGCRTSRSKTPSSLVLVVMGLVGSENHVFNMSDAGLANLESFDSKVYGNTFQRVKYGIRISLGGGNNEVYDNTFEDVTTCELLR